jgi:hypothetical protein
MISALPGPSFKTSRQIAGFHRAAHSVRSNSPAGRARPDAPPHSTTATLPPTPPALHAQDSAPRTAALPTGVARPADRRSIDSARRARSRHASRSATGHKPHERARTPSPSCPRPCGWRCPPKPLGFTSAYDARKVQLGMRLSF